MLRLLILLLGALLIAPARAETLPELGDSSQTVLSAQQERQLGESIMRRIRASKHFLDDPEVGDYINGLGYRLVAQSPNAGQAFEFFLVDDPSINAFALPGGFIGAHTGLIVNADSESELAAVLAHEVAHVTQRHIARMFQQQKQAGMASLAAIALAVLAARSSPDLASAAMAGAQYATIQTQLNFSRDNEREADRVGVQVLERSGLDPRAMPSFLERLQRAYRLYETNAPSYVRTHPLTYERIADVQNRVESMPYRQVPDSLEFQLVRARLQVHASSPRDAVERFEDILREKKTVSETAARYGLVLALLEAKELRRARRELTVLEREAPEDAMVLALAAQVRKASGDAKGALELYASAVQRHPRRRALIYDYAQSLLDAKRPEEALQVVTDAVRSLPPDARLYRLQARSHEVLGQRLQQHRAQAEAYFLMGSVPAAIEQLQIGLKSGDGDYYQLSSAEARLRELRALDQEARRKQ
ncbi:MAG TPA: M48 family metalloprotease [Burkholderiales bacterium]|nr:M48 family metalloprotease [Burkholderiales bacterium]